MSETEQLEKFRVVSLHTMNIVREMRKDIWKLQAHVLALRRSLSSLDPAYDKHFQGTLDAVETSLKNQKSDADQKVESLLDEVIGMLELNQKKKMN
jgi:hypothetical protein